MWYIIDRPLFFAAVNTNNILFYLIRLENDIRHKYGGFLKKFQLECFQMQSINQILRRSTDG